MGRQVWLRALALVALISGLLLLSGCMGGSLGFLSYDQFQVNDLIDRFLLAVAELDEGDINATLFSTFRLGQATQGDKDRLEMLLPDVTSVSQSILVERVISSSEDQVEITGTLHLVYTQAGVSKTYEGEVVFTVMRNGWDWLISAIDGWGVIPPQGDDTPDDEPIPDYNFPGEDENDIFDRIEVIIETQQFTEMLPMLAQTIGMLDGQTIHVMRRGLFIELLGEDFADVTVTNISFANRQSRVTLEGKLEVTANVHISMFSGENEYTEIEPFTMWLTEVTDGWVIEELTYSRRVFGIL